MSGMILRSLLMMLFAIAMSLAPVGAGSGVAMAATPADHHAAAMDDRASPMQGHCNGQPDQPKPDKPVGDSCCAAMCTAIAVTGATAAEAQAFARPAVRPGRDAFRQGISEELPTPPPRLV